jgi:hypothetical protein
MDTHDRLRAMTIRRLAPRSVKGGKGLACILKVSGNPVYNETTDTYETTETSTNTSGLRSRYKDYNIDGERIRQGDVRIYLSPVSTDLDVDSNPLPTPTPNPGDFLEYDGILYSIITVKSWRFAGVDCGWELQCRSS